MTLAMLYIAIICVCVIDLTDFVDHIKAAITYILTRGKSTNSEYSLKPFDCSLCATVWGSIIYLLVTSQFTLYTLMLALLIAISTPIIKDVIILIQSLINTAIQLIMRQITR